MKKIIVTLVTFIISTILMINISIAATGTLTTDNVNFREKATTESESMQRLNKGAKVNIIGEEDNWYKVKYKDKEGYISKDYVTVSEETKKEETAEAETNTETEITSTILVEETSLFVLPLLSSSKIATVTPSEKIEVLSKAGKWSYIQTSKLSGWVISSKITTINGEASTNNEENVEKEEKKEEEKEEAKQETKQEEESASTVKYVNVYSVNIREEPNTNSEILGSLDKNDSATIIKQEGDWYYVKLNDTKGYIKAEYLSDKKSN